MPKLLDSVKHHPQTNLFFRNRQKEETESSIVNGDAREEHENQTINKTVLDAYLKNETANNFTTMINNISAINHTLPSGNSEIEDSQLHLSSSLVKNLTIFDEEAILSPTLNKNNSAVIPKIFSNVGKKTAPLTSTSSMITKPGKYPKIVINTAEPAEEKGLRNLKFNYTALKYIKGASLNSETEHGNNDATTTPSNMTTPVIMPWSNVSLQVSTAPIWRKYSICNKCFLSLFGPKYVRCRP